MGNRQLFVGVMAILTVALSGCSDAAPPTPVFATDQAPSASATLNQTPASHHAALSDPFLQSALRARLPERSNLFDVAMVDLDGDKQDEAIVYAYGPMVCGTGGCNLLVLRKEGGAYRIVTQTSVTREPIGVLDDVSHGWRDLTVGVSGGGAQARRVRLRFDGKSYPTNPTTLGPSGALDGDEGRILINDPLEGQPLRQPRQ